MSLDPVPSSSDDLPAPSTPRRAPARRMTQRDLVILSLLKCPQDVRPRGRDMRG